MPGSVHNGDSDDNLAHRAFAQSSEAIMAVRSHERMDDLKFTNFDRIVSDMKKDIEGKIDEVKDMITESNKTMSAGFKSYDQKFWSLAIALILTLLSICGFLVAYTLFPGK